MKNFIQHGETVSLPAPYAVNGGDGLLVGVLFGVAVASAAAGEAVETKTTGVFILPAAVANVIAQGAKAYWDDTARQVTSTATGNTLIGAAIIAKANGDATIRVRLNGTV